MRDTIIKKASSSTVAAAALLFLLIFIAAMRNPELSPNGGRPYTYLALGDSYTIGEKLPREENFPNQTVRMLREKGVAIKSPVIVAKTGWTTDELQAAIKKTRLDKKYDFVTLLIGVNNQYRGRKIVDFIPQFESLLKQAIAFAGNDTNRVIVLSIPDWGVTPFAEGKDRKQIAQEIDEYNAASQMLTDKYHIHYLNITFGTRKAAENPNLLTEDSLHPSGLEYANWAKELAGVMKSRL